MSAFSISHILTILKTRREHCRDLLVLSRQQSQLIDADDYTQLLEVLGQKQRILGRLDEINQQHPDLKGQWQLHRKTAETLVRDDCEHVLAEMEAILAELLNTEKESTDQMIARRDATQRRLKAVSSGAQVHAAYRDSLAPATHRHLDVGQ